MGEHPIRTRGKIVSRLLQISLGPVQGFIAASRKTRDLAAGSRLLVELTQAAAATLQRDGATLIFPPTPGSPAANIVLAKVDQDPSGCAARAKEAALTLLKSKVRESAERAGRLVDPDAPLDEQAERLLEWFAAWAPLGADYAEARRRVGALMASRKALRDFPPAPREGEGRPKSPLDPSFAGVLRLASGWKVDRKDDPRVKDREHLDAVGLVKRFGPGPQSFPSTRAIACASALAEADPSKIEAFETLLKDYKDVADEGDALLGDLTELPPEVREQVRSVAQAIRKGLARKGVALRPYYAVVHADGDGMGEVLDHLARLGEEQHRAFSEVVSRFAGAVPDLVSRALGQTVFAGGDDVVALVPLDRAVDLARGLRDCFAQEVGSFVRDALGQGCEEPSLTVGVGAVHTLDNLQESVSFARSLEAKGKSEVFANGRRKNALAIGARPRGGADISCTGRWDDRFDEQFELHCRLLQSQGLPRGFPYEIRALANEIERLQASPQTRLGESSSEGEDSEVASLINAEVERILGRKERDMSYGPPRLLGTADLKRYADMLLVAHFFTREGAE